MIPWRSGRQPFRITLRATWFGAAVSLVVCLGSSFAQDKELPERDQPHVVRTQSEAVILDLVVRDGNGRAVRDLERDEIEVYENGVRQRVISFRSREEMVSIEETPQPAEGAAPDRSAPGDSPVDLFRQPNLVTLVFDRLSLESRRFARQGALDFLETGLPENALVSVFTIGHRLHVLQQFTDDRDQLREAIEKATSGRDDIFSEQSGQVQDALNELLAAEDSGAAGVGSIGQGNTPSGDVGADYADAAMAQMTVNMLQRFQELTREQQGISSIYSLLSLVGEQGGLAGRKTLVYFSEGLQVPPNLVERFRYTVSEANKANVSIYAVDARGLNSTIQSGAAAEMLRRVSSVSRRQVSDPGRAVTREQAMLMDNAEAVLRLNVQETLATLSESTGGFLIANTNDIRPAVHRLKEDLEVYYEVAYIPADLDYDGKFRQVTVMVNRPDVTVRTRSGYFAVPPSSDGSTVFPYEMPLLAALSTAPLPADFDYRAAAIRFHEEEEGVHYSLVMEVPLDAFTFRVDREAGIYTTRFSLMGLVKDMAGEIVERISQDYPLEGPASKVTELRETEILLVRHFHLPPGRYRLETAAYDHGTGRRCAKRSYLFVPGPDQGAVLSEVSVIGRIDPVNPDAAGVHNPFLVERGKIVPDLSGVVSNGEGATVSVFFVVYPDSALGPPDLFVQLVRDGVVSGQSRLELPSPRSDGSIPYVATLPTADLEPGRYEVRAVALQGELERVEHAFFEVVKP